MQTKLLSEELKVVGVKDYCNHSCKTWLFFTKRERDTNANCLSACFPRASAVKCAHGTINVRHKDVRQSALLFEYLWLKVKCKLTHVYNYTSLIIYMYVCTCICQITNACV